MYQVEEVLGYEFLQGCIVYHWRLKSSYFYLCGMHNFNVLTSYYYYRGEYSKALTLTNLMDTSVSLFVCPHVLVLALIHFCISLLPFICIKLVILPYVCFRCSGCSHTPKRYKIM